MVRSTSAPSGVAVVVADGATASTALGSPSAAAGDPAADRPEARSRGRLTIAPRVVEKVATIAVNEVTGVVAAGSGLDAVVGRRYPKVSADVAGDRATIAVDVAVEWGHPLATTATTVRDRVRSRVRDLVGISADAVDVTIARIVLPSEPTTGRVE